MISEDVEKLELSYTDGNVNLEDILEKGWHFLRMLNVELR